MKRVPLTAERTSLDVDWPFPIKISTVLIFGLLLSGIRPDEGFAAAATSSTGTTSDWTTHGGTLTGTRYSELADINTTTIGTLAAPGLVEEYAIQTGTNGSHMGAPLIVSATQTLYVVTPYPNSVLAYDLRNAGTLKWKYTPNIKSTAFGMNCCDTVNRGAAYGVTSSGRALVVFNALDATTIAVDALTGVQVWRTTLDDPNTGVTTNGAVLIVPNQDPAAKANSSLVVTGSSSGEMGVRGWVQALDLDTGAIKWKAYTTGPDSDVKLDPNYSAFYAKDKGPNQGAAADQAAAASWDNGAGSKWMQGGSSVWGYITYDPVTDLLFYGTSQPGVWNADQRPGDNKWGTSVFARKASNGLARWIYQVTPHDNWDYDSISESVPLDLLPANALPKSGGGTTTQIVVHFDKNGFAYTFDRLTGEILSAPKYGPSDASVNWASSIDLGTGLPIVNTNKYTHQGIVTKNICPSPMGLKGWEPSAFSPRTNLFYVPTFNLCADIEGLKAEFISGAPFMGQSMTIGPGPGLDAANNWFMGQLVAWDVTTQSRKWAISEPYFPIYGGVLATAGDLIFYTTLDNRFKGFSAIDGTKLFETALECSSVGSPVSFVGADGKQRIAVYSGVGWLAGGFSPSGKPCPGPSRSVTNGGGRVHVYKLR